MFDVAWVRFALSGTLIACFGIADRFTRRRTNAGTPPRSPLWVRVLLVLSLSAYYLLIGPTGRAWLGGAVNFAGIALVGAGIALRLWSSLPRADLIGRCLFYVGLPIAVGVPWGLAALSLPACASSIYCATRAALPGVDVVPATATTSDR